MANIRVFARIKPQLNNRKGKGRQSAASNLQWLVQEDDRELSIDPPGDTQLHGSGTPSSRSRGDRSKKRTFRFDHILSESASQEEVFDSVASGVVDRCLDGFNGTIFAYGVTGSGKTHTVEGSSRRYADRGLIARCLSHLFAKLADKEGCECSVHISYLEIYQDVGYDLLNPGARGRSMMANLPRVTITQQGDTVVIRKLSAHLAANEEVAMNLHFQGQANRKIAETPLNQRSSRSHAIFTIAVTIQETNSEVVTRSKLHLVDLAGSERVSKSGVQGQQLSEAKHINKSLHHLEHVIVMLHRQTKELEELGISGGGERHSAQSKRKSIHQPPASRGSLRSRKSTTTREDFGHIPYRNSLLTMVLKDSLGGNCYTAMVATIAQAADGCGEAISTCSFAQRVACITNAVVRNEELDDKAVIRKLKLRVAELEAEVERYRAALPQNPAILGEHPHSPHPSQPSALNADEKELCMRVMKQFLTGEISDPVTAGIDNVSKFRQCMMFLQLLIRSHAKRPTQTTSVAPAESVSRPVHPADTSRQQVDIVPPAAVHSTPGSTEAAAASSADLPSSMSVREEVHVIPAAVQHSASIGLYSEPSTGSMFGESHDTFYSSKAEHRTGQAKCPRKLIRKTKSKHAVGDSGDESTLPVFTQKLPDGPAFGEVPPDQYREDKHALGQFPVSDSTSPHSHRSSGGKSQAVSPTSTTTSPRQQRSPHISPSSLANLSKNQRHIFASEFEQKRAEDIERRSHRLLQVQTAQEQKQQHLILSQIILLEKEQRLHVESLSEALATQHARVKALRRQSAADSDIRQEKLAEQSLRKRHVDAHNKLLLVQQHLDTYRDSIAKEKQRKAALLEVDDRYYTQAHLEVSPSTATSPRSRGLSREVENHASQEIISTASKVSSPSDTHQPNGLVPKESSLASGMLEKHALSRAQPQALIQSSSNVTVTPKTDARKVMKVLAQQEEKQRKLNQQMQQYQQSQFEVELAAKERATRLKLQQFRAMLQGQTLLQNSTGLHQPPAGNSVNHSTQQQTSPRHGAGTAAGGANTDPSRSRLSSQTENLKQDASVVPPRAGTEASCIQQGPASLHRCTAWQSATSSTGLSSQGTYDATQHSELASSLHTSQQVSMKETITRTGMDHHRRRQKGHSRDRHKSSHDNPKDQSQVQSTQDNVTWSTPMTLSTSTHGRLDQDVSKTAQVSESKPRTRQPVSDSLPSTSHGTPARQSRYRESSHAIWPDQAKVKRNGLESIPSPISTLPEADQLYPQSSVAEVYRTPSLHPEQARSRRKERLTHDRSTPDATPEHPHSTQHTTLGRSTPGHTSNPQTPVNEDQFAQAAQSPRNQQKVTDAHAGTSPSASHDITRAGPKTPRGKQLDEASSWSTSITPKAMRPTTKDQERQFLSAAQRQRERVDRIRRAQQAAKVIQRAWRRHKSLALA